MKIPVSESLFLIKLQALILQYFQENICFGVDLQIYLKVPQTHMFSFEYGGIFGNTYLEEHQQTAAFVSI